jgi:hypothetical protein
MALIVVSMALTVADRSLAGPGRAGGGGAVPTEAYGRAATQPHGPVATEPRGPVPAQTYEPVPAADPGAASRVS